MSATAGIPHGSAIAINELLDQCAGVQPGQQVLIVAAYDGLYGGANIVDQQTIAWLQAAVQRRGAYPSVLWLDVPTQPHAWRVPPVLKAALGGADIFINHLFDMPWEEIIEMRQAQRAHNVPMVRNMASTAALLSSRWAQTPYELVKEIRFQAGRVFHEGATWSLTHPNGTQLTGRLGRTNPSFSGYTELRSQSLYRPFPEGVFPPVITIDTEGIFVFERTTPWWARYIGIPTQFHKPVRLTIEKNHIVRFEGGYEANALKRFYASLAERVSDMVYRIAALHGGVHPHARVPEHLCTNATYRAFIEHHHATSVHLHLGASPQDEAYPYMLHVTGELPGATLQIGDAVLYDRGHLTALDHPDVRAIAERYPERPGLPSTTTL